MKDEKPNENVCLLTYSCDDSNGIEKSSCKSPHDRVLILLPIPTLLLHGNDQLLLKPLEAGGHLSTLERRENGRGTNKPTDFVFKLNLLVQIEFGKIKFFV